MEIRASLDPSCAIPLRWSREVVIGAPCYWMTLSARYSTDGGIAIPNCFAVFEIDRQLKFRRLLYWQIAGLSAFEDLVHVCGGTAPQISKVYPVGHQPAGLNELLAVVNRRQTVLCCKV